MGEQKRWMSWMGWDECDEMRVAHEMFRVCSRLFITRHLPFLESTGIGSRSIELPILAPWNHGTVYG